MLCVKNTSNNIIRIERGGIIKKKILTAVLSFVLMAVLPLLSLRAVNDSIDNAEGKPQMNKVSEPSEKKDVSDISAPKKLSSDENTFIILDTSSGQKITVSDEEFCIGALAYEMPPSFETEALKAQCTACYTRFCRIRTNEIPRTRMLIGGSQQEAVALEAVSATITHSQHDGTVVGEGEGHLWGEAEAHAVGDVQFHIATH